MGLHSAQSGARRNLGGDSCSWEMKHSEPSRFMSVNQTSEVIASKKPPCNLQLEILSMPLLLNSIPASSKGDDFVSVIGVYQQLCCWSWGFWSKSSESSKYAQDEALVSPALWM